MGRRGAARRPCCTSVVGSTCRPPAAWGSTGVPAGTARPAPRCPDHRPGRHHRSDRSLPRRLPRRPAAAGRARPRRRRRPAGDPRRRADGRARHDHLRWGHRVARRPRPFGCRGDDGHPRARFGCGPAGSCSSVTGGSSMSRRRCLPSGDRCPDRRGRAERRSRARRVPDVWLTCGWRGLWSSAARSRSPRSSWRSPSRSPPSRAATIATCSRPLARARRRYDARPRRARRCWPWWGSGPVSRRGSRRPGEFAAVSLPVPWPVIGAIVLVVPAVVAAAAWAGSGLAERFGPARPPRRD